MADEKTALVAAANVLAPAFCLLKAKGYEVRFDLHHSWWVAEKSDVELITDSTIELWGLAYIHESKGTNWAVSDNKIDSYLALDS
ncbi:MAG: hypothetical protein ACRYFR_11000 [Janthinobacterium lividum]